jgi:Uncharacterised BCR, YnfA/UPF0060 family
MSVLCSIALFALAALAEIGGAWLVWQGLRERRGLLWIGAGVLATGPTVPAPQGRLSCQETPKRSSSQPNFLLKP